MSKFAAIAIVRDKDGRVLTVARKEPPYEQALPGGGVDDGETPEQAVRREVREECGLVLGDVWPESEYDKASQTWRNLVLESPEDAETRVCVFRCCSWSGVAVDVEGPIDASGERKAAVQWLTPPELLAQAKTFKSSVERLLDGGALASQWNAADKVVADLGAGDVHTPGAAGPGVAKTKVKLASLPTKKRNELPDDKFAWPERRKFPIENAAHVRDAAARLAEEVNAGLVSKSTAATIHKRIFEAGKAFGVEITANNYGRQATGAAIRPAPLKTRRGRAKADRSGRLDVTIDHPQHGRLEIRHMRDIAKLDGRTELADSGSVCFYAKTALAPIAGIGDAPTWNQISTRGVFAGHGAGKFSLDDKVFQDVVRNYREVDGEKVAFDFEHASEQDAASGSIPVTGAPAQGWIRDLRIAPDGLHALVEWLEPAKTYIREKKYQFVSPAIRFGAVHPITGKPIGARLTSSALTNQPFLRGLQPLAAKDAPGAASPPHAAHGKPLIMSTKTLAHSTAEFMPKIKACLGMHELSTPAECAEKMKALRELCKASADGVSGGVPVGEYVDKLRDELGAPMGSTVEDIFDAVDAMISAAIAEHEERFHEGQIAAGDDVGGDVGMSARVAANNEDTMADLIALKDATTKLTAAETQVSTLTLKLNERESKVAELTTENARLLKDLQDRDATAIEDRVQEAFDTYKDSQKLTDKHMTMMRVTCKADRRAFDDVYPRIPVVRRHLLRDIAGTNGGARQDGVPLTTEAGAHPPAGSVVVDGVLLGASANDTTVQLMDKDPAMSFADAQAKALQLHSKAGR